MDAWSLESIQNDCKRKSAHKLSYIYIIYKYSEVYLLTYVMSELVISKI